MMSLQKDEDRRSIEQAIIDGTRAFSDGQRVCVPAPIVLAVGRKP